MSRVITPAFVVAMATYNTHMNREVYAAAARLNDDARRMDRGSFWSSIHGTLSHLIWADQMWMSRFDGWAKPGVSQKASDRYIEDFGTMQTVRDDLDARLEAWGNSVEQSWLDAEQHWFSGSLNQQVCRARTTLVAHMFNHQTHHRGQAHAMITAAGESTGATDLFVIV